jgi:hypothetical protein
MKRPVEIIASRDAENGKIYTFSCSDAQVEVLFLNHSIERARKWQLSIEQIAECLLLPDEVLVGHFSRYIAHKVIGKHLIRAVYEYVWALPALITVYFPYIDRHFQGGLTYEDKILK